MGKGGTVLGIQTWSHGWSPPAVMLSLPAAVWHLSVTPGFSAHEMSGPSQNKHAWEALGNENPLLVWFPSPPF